jgi:flagellar motility protein MotE (MotC chaperone)
MSKQANPGLLQGNRPLAGPAGGGLRGPGLSPLPPQRKRSGRWLFWLVLIPLLLLGLTYLLGRTVEPVRVRLAKVPLAGNLLFGDKVWPILWNKPATPAKTPTPSASQGAPTTPTTTPGPSAAQTAAQQLLDQAQARLAAAEAKENDLKKREADLKAQADQLKTQTDKLAKAQADVEGLKVQLQGQLRTEQDRVEIVRAMRSSAQVQFFSALTDDEAVAVLKYMSADEVSKILAGMDSYRAARIFYRLPTVAQPPTTP